MQHITGVARNQMVFTSLEDSISGDNPGWLYRSIREK